MLPQTNLNRKDSITSWNIIPEISAIVHMKLQQKSILWKFIVKQGIFRMFAGSIRFQNKCEFSLKHLQNCSICDILLWIIVFIDIQKNRRGIICQKFSLLQSHMPDMTKSSLYQQNLSVCLKSRGFQKRYAVKSCHKNARRQWNRVYYDSSYFYNQACRLYS